MNIRPDSAAVELAIPLKLLDAEPGHYAFFCWQNLTMTAWGRAATGPAVHRIDAAGAPILKERREGLSAIHLVTEGAGMPTAEAREGFVRSMKVNARTLQCISVVLMGGGFWASTLQSIVTGMRMLAPNTFAMRIDNGFDSMLNWFPAEHLRRTGVTLQPNELRSAMTQAFAHLTQDNGRLAEKDALITATHAIRRR